MNSLQQTRELLLLANLDGLITDEELILLYDVKCSKNLKFPYHDYDRFDLDSMDESECQTVEFRFGKDDIPRLFRVLQIPRKIVCDQGTKSEGMEAFCMLLKRLAYPCRYSDMIHRFGRSVPEICMVTNKVLDFIYDHHRHRVTNWNNTILSPLNLQVYADAIADKGAALDNCFGFIDGTVRPICKPGKLQRIVYNGHKKVHALKFQSLVLPNGLIGNLYGPVEGKRHDARMLADSQLLPMLEQHAFSPQGTPMCLYGDPAYPLRVHLMSPFRNAILTENMRAFNKSMSSVRVSVEWLFADIINYFKFMDFKKNLKIGLSSVGKMYVVCAILRNALTCLYRNTTSLYFEVEPPMLEEYFV